MTFLKCITDFRVVAELRAPIQLLRIYFDIAQFRSVLQGNMATLNYTTLDVFTTTRYAGNPLAVVKVPAGLSLTQDQKQAVAKEFNYSETVFLHQGTNDAASKAASNADHSVSTWRIDIFTILSEIPLAGHPVIGTACSVLGEQASLDDAAGELLRKGAFITKAGPIRLSYDVQQQSAEALLPHDVHVHQQVYPFSELQKLQPSLSGAEHMRGGSPVVSIVKGMTFVLVDTTDLPTLGSVSPTMSYSIDAVRDADWNVGLIGLYFFSIVGIDAKGASLETSLEATVDVRTRMVESTIGEDPATGSAACTFASWLALRDRPPYSTTYYNITQGVEMGRKSEIGVRVVLGSGTGSDKTISEVWLTGQAIPVMSGQIRL